MAIDPLVRKPYTNKDRKTKRVGTSELLGQIFHSVPSISQSQSRVRNEIISADNNKYIYSYFHYFT